MATSTQGGASPRCSATAPNSLLRSSPYHPGHPYLRLPLQFATSLEPRLLDLVGRQELDRLRAEAETEIATPRRWGTTFTLIQAWRRS